MKIKDPFELIHVLPNKAACPDHFGSFIKAGYEPKKMIILSILLLIAAIHTANEAEKNA